MTVISRRTVMAGAICAASGLHARAATSAASGMSNAGFREVLMKRRSIRAYDAREIEEELLSEMLWSAIGINRPDSGGRTAPSWHTSYGTDIYVADGRGVRKFDPVAASLAAVVPDDIRAKASPQPFVATAPTVLIYVADLARMHEAPREEQVQAVHVDTGIIAQNVYLFCAAEGLGTCLVGGADRKGLAALLKLPETQFVTFVQPVGHPKQAA